MDDFPDTDLEADLYAYLGKAGYEPQDSGGIARGMGVDSRRRAELRALLEKGLRQGRLLKLRKGCYALRKDPRERAVFGHIISTASGRLLFRPDEAGQAQVQALVPGAEVRTLAVDSRRSRGAMDGDRVRVSLRVQGGSMRFRRGHRGPRSPQAGDLRVTVYVEEILERGHEQWVGTYRRGGRFGIMAGDGVTAPEIVYLDTAPPEDLESGTCIVVEPVSYPIGSMAARGRLVEVLGDTERADVQITAIIRKFGLREEFPPAVLAEADRLPQEVPAADCAGREDCRAECSITIDPESARDYDDAISVRRTAAGWELAVHIADVAHYVRPGTALDAEAQKRGNSTYLPDRVLPMLPPRLCDGICSLRQGVDRLTALCRMQVAADGSVEKAQFSKAVICSRRRMTYAQALEVLRGGSCGDAEVDAMLREAAALAATLRARRMALGALNLDMPEVRVTADAQGNPTRVEITEGDEAHSLIEECMLAANEAVAQRLNALGLPAIYRVHEAPDPAKLHEFSLQLRSYGISAGTLATRRQLADTMELLHGHADEEALKLALLRCMMRARYSPDALGHYGLAKGDYCHFTSPIRRYADLVVHRAFLRLCGASAPLPPRGRLADISAHISETERTSAAAEAEADRYMLTRYLQQQCSAEQPRAWDAVVTACWAQGLAVDIPLLRAKGFVSGSELPQDTRWFYGNHFWNSTDGRRISPGSRMRLIPIAVDAATGFADFRPAPQEN